MQLLKDFFQLFYPNLCTTCNNKLLKGETVICAVCRHDLPIINHTDYKNNRVAQTFFGRIPIEKATSFLYFRKVGKTRELIHSLKYKGNQEIGAFLGSWFGEILNESNQFSDVDYIIPVPLHKKRLQERGYNQLTKFGEVLSEILKIPYNNNVLIRISSTKTQTYKERFERFSNSQTNFTLTDFTKFKNKHILLIDDVITTGATLESCCNELLKTENIKISIVTMAFTE
ncbi:ComF family protein [Tenacibaculum aquimarinum]|uniref:ComF family protein n=1 Tax=Tenacibaculum aquimarinum TaxID=2910675 RepID=UPI001F0AA665|nr:ComF family protein [Tenacibaculum aquimarinum]MCH3883717.1 ComF family protein [Tenacibaculum aquimarinum]